MGWFPFPPGVTFDAFGEAFARMRENAGVFIGAGAVAVILPAIIQQVVSVFSNLIAFGSITGASSEPSLTGLITSIGVSVVLTLLTAGVQYGLYMGLALMGMDAILGRPVEFRVFDGFKNFLNLTIVCALILIMMIVGFVLLIIPGLIVIALTCFAPMYVITENLKPVEAIQKSINVTKPYIFPMIGFLIVMGLLCLVGVCLCFVASFYFYPVAYIAFAYLFLANNPEYLQQAPAPMSENLPPMGGGGGGGGWTPPPSSG